MYSWQLSCFRQMLKFVNQLRHMPDTTLTRMALCDAIIADHWDYQHNNWFAQLMSFCDKIPVLWPLWDVDGKQSNIPSFNAAQCVARLKKIYSSGFTSAGSDHPKMQQYGTVQYHTCFASHLPPLHKQWDAQPYLRTALNTTNESIIYRTVQVVIPPFGV
jgi:hypothetical protein